MAERIWFVVPAAGASRRLGGAMPKQYLRIAGRTVLEHALGPLLAHAAIAAGAVVIAEDDLHWAGLPEAVRSRVVVAPGGRERADSVLSGLRALESAAPEDWVLVHDAARPCLAGGDLDRLIGQCRPDPVGGLLATPVTDTLKRSGDDQRVLETVAREGLWQAQTPQMFRQGLLLQALTGALAAGECPTDEAAAVERMGLRPRLVEGSTFNIKITRAADVEFAARVLASRPGEST